MPPSKLARMYKKFRRRFQLPLIFLLALVLASLVAPAAIAGQPYGPLPVRLQAIGMADYGGEDHEMMIQPLELALIADMLRDREPLAVDSTIRLTAVANSLLTPVPVSDTRQPTAAGSSTEAAASSTTPNSSATAPATGTTLPFTSTPTKLAASATPTPSPTQPTATPAPPTPTVDVCGAIYLDDYQRSGPMVRWELHNSSGTSVNVTSISLGWPSENGSLISVEFGGSVIWNQGGGNPPTSLGGSWGLASHSSKRLLFQFSELAAFSGYSLSVVTSNGCTLSASG